MKFKNVTLLLFLLAVMGLFAPKAFAADYLLSGYTTAIRAEGSWTPGNYGGHDGSLANFPGAALRFKATTTSVGGMLYRDGEKFALYVDGVRYGVVTAPNDSVWGDTTLFTGLDGSSEHTYVLVEGSEGQYFSYITVNSLNTSALTARPVIAWYGDSTIAGTAGTSNDASLADSFTVCNTLGYACSNSGYGGTTVKHFLASNDGETRFADITGISPAPTMAFIRYGLNDTGQVGGAETAMEFQTAYTNMLTSLTAGLPSTVFYAASIIKTGGVSYPSDRSTWDAAILAAVSSVNTLRGNSNIKFIDTTGWTEYIATAVSGQTADDVHPTSAGYALLANRELPLLASSGVTATGPSSGNISQASTNFTVTLATGATFTGNQTVTIGDGSNGGTFTPSVGSTGVSTVTVTPANSSTSFTFTYTPASAGTKTISFTNAQGWNNPSNISYVVSAPASTGCSSSYTYDYEKGIQTTVSCGVTSTSTIPGFVSNTPASIAVATTTNAVASTSPAMIICPNGNIFNTVTGEKCTVFIDISVVTRTIFTKDLKLGMADIDIQKLQQFLNTHGFMVSPSGAGSIGNETTLFGSLTQKALIKFQLANYIHPAVGYFGPVTRKIINKTN